MHNFLNSATWHCPPGPELSQGASEQQPGWRFDGTELRIIPAERRDFWMRTYYDPLLCKDDAAALTCTATDEATLDVRFTLESASQFDQAGAFVRVGEHTVKAGIENVDGTPRLSVVVTAGHSDWSTQPWTSKSLRVRIHKLQRPGGACLLVEAGELDSNQLSMVRIAPFVHGPWQMGVFAASPVVQRGCVAVFHSIHLGKPQTGSIHEADPLAAAV
mmetsp:Transcript_179/g.254  ORF Transcript_179/g.254 Transcript_179/m.254 type:complete len:217 (+) Transcript_179:118-768(+)